MRILAASKYKVLININCILGESLKAYKTLQT